MTCRHGLDRNLIDCLQCEAEEKARTASAIMPRPFMQSELIQLKREYLERIKPLQNCILEIYRFSMPRIIISQDGAIKTDYDLTPGQAQSIAFFKDCIQQIEKETFTRKP